MEELKVEAQTQNLDQQKDFVRDQLSRIYAKRQTAAYKLSIMDKGIAKIESMNLDQATYYFNNMDRTCDDSMQSLIGY